MKLHLTPQALRLRLTDDDLQALAQAGELRHTLLLGNPGLTYTLRQLPPEASGGLRARHKAGALTVEVPAALARQLVEGTAVSLKGEVGGTDGQLIRILVEKDLGPSH